MNKYIVIGFLVATILISVFAVVLLSGNTTTNTASAAFDHLSPQQFDQSLQKGTYTLLDIRTVDEYKAGHLKNANQIDYYQTQKFSDYLDSLDKNKSYLIYCRSGHRSGNALQLMQQKGFKSVSDLAGGYNAWATSGFQVER